MPLTITLPTIAIGPQFTVQVKSDFVGPIADGWHYEMLTTELGNESSQVQWVENPRGVWIPGLTVDFTLDQPFVLGTGIKTQAPCVVEMQLYDNQHHLLDQGQTSTNPPWDPIGAQWRVQGQSTTGDGSFTQTDRDTINATQTTTAETNQLSLAIQAATQAVVNIAGTISSVPIGQVLSWLSPDTWRLVDLSGGVTCGRVDVDLSSDALWGVILRITQYPDTTVFRTPDSAWSFKDLAVLTFIHAGDIVERHGIHSTSHTVSPLPYVALPWPNNFGWPVQPSDYHVTVDWADGVCGELLGLRLP